MRHLPVLTFCSVLFAATAGARDLNHPGNLSYTIDLARPTELSFAGAGSEGARLILRDGSLRFSGGRAPAPAVDYEAPRAGQHELTIKLRPVTWEIYIDQTRVARLPAALRLPLTTICNSAGETIEGRFQKVGEFEFTDDFMVDPEDDDPLREWTVVSGDWRLHTVIDDARERGVSRPRNFDKRPPEPTRSPNFYSLVGQGEPAVIVAGHPFLSDYSVSAAIQLASGAAGVVSHHQPDDSGFALVIVCAAAADEPAAVELWHYRGDGSHSVLDRACVGLLSGQWVKLRLQADDGCLSGLVDGTPIVAAAPGLPVGGRFGLLAAGTNRLRFDDVAVSGYDDIALTTAAEVALATLNRVGLSPVDDGGGKVSIAAGGAPRPTWLTVGAPEHEGHVFSATFDALSQPAEIGLLAGVSDAAEPLLFSCRTKGDGCRFALTAGTEGTGAELASADLDGFTVPLKLTTELDRNGTVFGYCNGRLVLMHQVPNRDGTGASGIWVGAGTRTTVGHLHYSFEPLHDYHSRLEKNRIFAEDPFMRHWSSPEGEWLHAEPGQAWYKGDFFARVALQLPPHPTGRIQLGIGEHHNAGDLVLEITEDALTSTDSRHGEVVTATLPPGDGQLRIIYQDHWLWVQRDEQIALSHLLQEPLTGRRIRLDAFSDADLALTTVVRYEMKDFLFSEAPSDWRRNGGSWEIVNRFQCDPRWSHMNGENAENLAAMWAKYTLEGDFCIELYAGIRHEWYERCGDINLTVMNQATTASQGYTVTCTGWDFDHSQKWTRLYRDGELVAQSDKYLVPRFRDHNVRRNLNPLVETGRDVHGAWYYLKLRRIGGEIEYWFDNELVFSWHDAAPLPAGGLGIWTYRNSLMVARVKMAAEHIYQQPTPEIECPEAGPDTPEPMPTLGGYPPPMAPARWYTDDDVGRGHLSWHDLDARPCFTVTNRLGGGTLAARYVNDPISASQLAGWQFEIKRSATAQFNFHFVQSEIGSGDEGPRQRFFHRLSGTSFSAGEWQKVGSTDLNATLADSWQPVTVWAPRPPADSTAARQFQVEGFGELQPSFEQQGLHGNGPGTAYAVADFTPITYGLPDLTCAEPLQLLSCNGEPIEASGGFLAIAKRLEALARPGLNRCRLRIGTMSAGHVLAWIALPETLDWQCTWSIELPNAIVLSTTAEYPDPRFHEARLYLGAEELPLTTTAVNQRLARVPPEPHLRDQRDVKIEFRDSVATVTLPPPGHTVPVFLGITAAFPLCETFNRGEVATHVGFDSARMCLPPTLDGGRFLHVFNPGAWTRLTTNFDLAEISTARYPLLQFNYRAEDMTNVSLCLDGRHFFDISEDYAERRPPLAPAWQRDGQWHAWTGLLAGIRPYPVREDTQSFCRLTLGSMADLDRTGRYSYLDLDDVVIGPAIATGSQLRCTPHYHDLAGIEAVRFAVCNGTVAYAARSAAEREALTWATAAPEAVIEPTLAALTDGVSHLLLKAVSRSGGESAVTDLPFLLDRRPPMAQAEDLTAAAVWHHGRLLRLTFAADDGAPIDLASLEIRHLGQRLSLGDEFSSYTADSTASILDFNWPYVLRGYLRNADLTAPLALQITGIRDGAGNTGPDIAATIPLQTGRDTTGPTWLPPVFPTAVHYALLWLESRDPAPQFVVKGATIAPRVVQPVGDLPYVELHARGRAGHMVLSTRAWNPYGHGFLSFRFRAPDATSEHQPSLSLLLRGRGWGSVTIELLGPAAPGPWRDGNVEPDVWYPVIIDLQALHRAPAREQARIAELIFTYKGGESQERLQMRDIYVHRRFSEWEVIDLDGYDASGVAGLDWQVRAADGQILHRGTQTELSFRPNDGVQELTGEPAWLELYLKDRAGNLSQPLAVPLP